MAVFNAAKREIDLKIVYYGPAMCGKTTNVQCIHKMLSPQQRGELMSLATKDDRTLFFDFLPIELGDVRGFKTRFHIYTVPGQVYYALTRRAVLTGADGVVFVADSQTSKMQENIESLKDLADNLKFYKKDISTFPFVLQYNKRDLKNITSVAELNAALNSLDVPCFESSAVTGMGVVETLTAICKIVLKQMDSGTAKKKPYQPPVPPQGKVVAAPAAPAPAAPAPAAPEAPDIRIFSQQQAEAPPKAEPPQPPRKPEPPPAAPKLEPPPAPPAPSFAPAPPVFDDSKFRLEPTAPPAGAPGPGLTLEEPAESFAEEPDLSFDEDIAELSLDEHEPALEEGGDLSFDDSSALTFDEADISPEQGLLSFDASEEAAVAEPEISIEEPELTFDEDLTDLSIEDEHGQALEGPELSFDDSSALSFEEEPAEVEGADLTFEEPAVIADEAPEVQFEEPGLVFEQEQGAGLRVVSCGQPQKISDTAIKVPVILRLGRDDTECSVTVTVSFDELTTKH